MSGVQRVTAPAAPVPPGPFSHASVHNGLVWISGQVGFSPVDGLLVQGGITAECRQTLSNIRAIAEAAGTSLAHAVKVMVYLRTMDDFAAMNEVYQEFFTPPYPARATVQSDLQVAIEIDAVVAVSPTS